MRSNTSETLARSLLAATVVLGFTAAAPAAIIVDTLVESSTGWTSPFWDSTASGGLIAPVDLEVGGTEIAGPLGQASGGITSPAFGGTLQAGTYTIYYGLGNYSNVTAIASTYFVDFAGLTEIAALGANSTVVPAPGGWALQSHTWTVNFGDAEIGNALDFFWIGTQGGGSWNGAVDGVGSLTSLGDGFLVDFVAAPTAPEPSALVLAAVGLVGISVVRRRRTRT